MLSFIIEIFQDTYIVKPLSARGKNYDIIVPETGVIFRFSGGTKHPLRQEVANGLSEQIGGTPSNWQHFKGHGVKDYCGEEPPAEVHRFQEETAGKVKFKIKRWEDED